MDDLVDLLLQVAGGALGLDQVDVGVAASADAVALAARAAAVVVADDRARERLGRRRLARAGRADEQVGVAHVPALDRGCA